MAAADGCGELVGIARGGSDAVSCGEQGFDECESETAGRAGYEPDLGWVLGIPFGVGVEKGFRLPLGFQTASGQPETPCRVGIHAGRFLLCFLFLSGINAPTYGGCF